jgi:hypothetical protein
MIIRSVRFNIVTSGLRCQSVRNVQIRTPLVALSIFVKIQSKVAFAVGSGLTVSPKMKTIIFARMAADGWKGLILGFFGRLVGQVIDAGSFSSRRNWHRA